MTPSEEKNNQYPQFIYHLFYIYIEQEYKHKQHTQLGVYTKHYTLSLSLQYLTGNMWKRRKSNADGDAPAKKYQKKSYVNESNDNDSESIVVCEVSTIFISPYFNICIHLFYLCTILYLFNFVVDCV